VNAQSRFSEWATTEAALPRHPTVLSTTPLFLPFWAFSARLTVKGPHGNVTRTLEASERSAQVYAGHALPRDLLHVAKGELWDARPFERGLTEGAAFRTPVDVHAFGVHESTAWELVVAQLAEAEGQVEPLAVADLASRRLLLPVWEVQYSYLGQTMCAYINAVNGEVFGVQQKAGAALLRAALKKGTAKVPGAADASLRLLRDLLDGLRSSNEGGRIIVTLLSGALTMLKPFARLLLSPPVLLALGAVFASSAVHPILWQRLTFSAWEATREAERLKQSGKADTWKHRQLRTREAPHPPNAAGAGEARTGARKPPRVEESDPFAVLGVSHLATTEEVHAAFRRELQLYHPDHSHAAGWDEEEASNRTRLILEAYAILRDPAKRAAHRRGGRG
jgi:DnaJ-domain-containing protein 1